MSETEVEALERRIPKHKKNGKIHPLKIKAMEWELTARRLEHKIRILEGFARHLAWCESSTAMKECDCGLDNLLKS